MIYHPPFCVIPYGQLDWERLLPLPGQVLVRVGDRVEATDVVARALRPGPLCAVNVARALGVGNTAVPRYMVKREGEDVEKGEVLATRGKVFRKRCKSPVAGTIISIAHGRILLETTPSAIELYAHVRGEVISVVPNYGAIIRTIGAMVSGVWGTGKEAYGLIRVVVEERDEPLRAALIDVSCHGSIIVGGSSADREALQQAAEVNARAVVVGSIDAELMKAARHLSFPVVITQGLGDLPMAEPIFQLFQIHQAREAVVTQQEKAWGMERPQIVIPLPVEQVKPLLPAAQRASLEVGSRVHLTRPPYAGLTGHVTGLPVAVRQAETGMRFWGVEVLLDNGQNITTPITNLELVS